MKMSASPYLHAILGILCNTHSQLHIYAISLVLKVFPQFFFLLLFCKEFLLHLRSTLFTFNIITTLSFLSLSLSFSFFRSLVTHSIYFEIMIKVFFLLFSLSIIVKLEETGKKLQKKEGRKVFSLPFSRLIVFLSCFFFSSNSYVGNRN